jgi:sugar O-acyltransferase (sialic acid O-acetyltransferase NeuD family)
MAKVNLITVGFESDIDFEISNNSEINYLGYFSLDDLNNHRNYLGSYDTLDIYLKNNKSIKIISAMGSPKIREMVYSKYKDILYTYISNNSKISHTADIGLGSFIQSYCFISNNVSIGVCCKINHGSTFCHDSKLGNFSDTSPQSFIGGNSSIGNYSYLGANCSIRQNIKICNNVTVGMGGVVIKNIDKPGVYVGNPVVFKK